MTFEVHSHYQRSVSNPSTASKEVHGYVWVTVFKTKKEAEDRKKFIEKVSSAISVEIKEEE
jgi:hypothetical protein